MGNRRKLMLAAAIGALAVGIPAAVLARAAGEVFTPATQSYSATGTHSTNSANFQAVPGLQLPVVGIGNQLNLSVQMAKGKARFRIVGIDFGSTLDNAPTPHAGVTFSAPASNSFTFFDRDTCQQVGVQWQRVGNTAAKMQRATLTGVGDSTAC